VPQRAQRALIKREAAENWGVRPWERDKLSAKDRQDISLAMHAKSYQQEQARENAGANGSQRLGGQRSKTNSKQAREFYKKHG